MKLALMTNMVLVLALLPVVGCGDDDAAAVCEAGRQVTCACTGGAEGFQRCRADGSGFDDCECSAPMDGGGGGDDAGGGADSGPAASGPPDSGLACDDGIMHAVSSPECLALRARRRNTILSRKHSGKSGSHRKWEAGPPVATTSPLI